MMHMLGADAGYRFVLPYGLTDTLEMCSHLPDIEKRLGGHITLMIKSSHQFIADDCGVTNYIILDDIGVSTVGRSHDDVIKQVRTVFARDIEPVPTVGKVYMAHPGCNIWISKNMRLMLAIASGSMNLNDMYRQFFDISESDAKLHRMRLPQGDPGFEHTVFVMLNCRSLRQLTVSERGAILSAVRRDHPNSRILTDGDVERLSMREMLAHMAAAEHVYAYKSGLCDILVNLGKKLTVFYPDQKSYNSYSAASIFGDNENDERILR